MTSVDIQPPLRIQKAVIRSDASNTVALRFRQQRSAFVDSILKLFSGLTNCAPGGLGLTEEIGRLELVSDFGNLTLGYFTAMGRQAAFRKFSSVENFEERLAVQSNLKTAGTGNQIR